MTKYVDKYKKSYRARNVEVMSFNEYLDKAKSDKSLYASPSERMLKAIGEPTIVDTALNPRQSRIFSNRVIKLYPSFSDFYGLESVIERIVSFFVHASQGLEESRQILYLLGPVGSAKSSLAERLKKLMEQEPIYVLADAEGNSSPINESPLGLVDSNDADELGIDARYLQLKASPWALKRLEEYQGDISKFKVIKRFPSQDRQIALSKTEPGDENNQDISCLVGKLDIRKLEFYSQNDPDAYNYSGGLCLSNQGLLEFVEMFKAPIKVLHPLLTATQEHNYKGTEAISAIPFDGIIVAHSNESEWSTFKGNKQNEAFLDRVYIVEVPYCLRVDDEVKVYEKLLNSSLLKNAPRAPGTLEILAEFSILTRLDEPEHGDIYSKLKVYNGDNLKDKDATVVSITQFKDESSRDEGFHGISTRLAYKILAEVYNFDVHEVAANPVHMLYVIEQMIEKERLSSDLSERYLEFLSNYLKPFYASKLEKDIQTCYLESYTEYGQSLFDRYILYADHWVQDNDFRDPDTGTLYNRKALDSELSKIEKPASIGNPKDFRHEIVNFALRYRADHKGANPSWKSYEKLKQVIESNMFKNVEDLLPVISFEGSKGSSENRRKHAAFIERMTKLGYTERQVKMLGEWYMRYSQS